MESTRNYSSFATEQNFFTRSTLSMQASSDFGTIAAPSRLTGIDAERGVEIEGWLRRKRGLLHRNKKSYYKVIGTNMYIATNNQRTEFQNKYDLTLYAVGMNKKESKEFYLEPIDKSLKLNILRFIAESASDRAHWFKYLNELMKEDEGNMNRSFISGNSRKVSYDDAQMPAFAGSLQAIDDAFGEVVGQQRSLNEISEYLTQSDGKLDRAFG